MEKFNPIIYEWSQDGKREYTRDVTQKGAKLALQWKNMLVLEAEMEVF